MQWCSELTAAQVPVSLDVLDWAQEALSPQNTPGTWQDGTFGFARPLFGRACFLSGLYLMICLPVVLGGAVFCGKLMTTCHIWNLRGERERSSPKDKIENRLYYFPDSSRFFRMLYNKSTILPESQKSAKSTDYRID